MNIKKIEIIDVKTKNSPRGKSKKTGLISFIKGLTLTKYAVKAAPVNSTKSISILNKLNAKSMRRMFCQTNTTAKIRLFQEK